MAKKILFTGAGGAVGRNLSPYLSALGYDVINIPSAQYDFTDKETVKKLTQTPDIFILAGFYGIAEPSQIPADIAAVNLKIFNNFFDVSGGRPVFTFGSGAEYGKSNPIIKAKEEDAKTTTPQDAYGMAKKLISDEGQKYANVYNLRLFGVYGPHELEQRFITYAIKQNLKKRPIEINQNVVFDYLYVKDLCEITARLIKTLPKTRILNINPTQSIDLVTITKIINNTGDMPSAVSIKKAGLNNEYTGDNTRLLAALPGLTFTPYEQGIKEFYNYLKNRQGNIK